MNSPSERPLDYPPTWPWPPVPYQDIPTPHLESVNDAVLRCLQAAHEIRLWAASWPTRLDRPTGVTDHFCAIRDLMAALSIAEPLLDACRDEFARVNNENVTVAGEIDASFHAGSYHYSMQFAKVAAITIDSLLTISPPHPVTGESEMDILGLPELRPGAYAMAARQLPLVDHADLVASMSRECARAQAARDDRVPNPPVDEVKAIRARTTQKEAEASATRLYHKLWKVDRKAEWGRQIGKELNRGSVDPRTIEKLPSWQKAERRRDRSAAIGQRLHAIGMTGKILDGLTDPQDGGIDAIIQKLDEDELERLKTDKVLQALLSEQQKEDSTDHQSPDA